MTRDEAIKLAHEKWTKEGTKCSESIVDILCALGILKLDEPKDKARELFMDIIEGYGDLRSLDAQRILASVERNGLRIVEK